MPKRKRSRTRKEPTVNRFHGFYRCNEAFRNTDDYGWEVSKFIASAECTIGYALESYLIHHDDGFGGLFFLDSDHKVMIVIDSPPTATGRLWEPTEEYPKCYQPQK